MTPDPLNTSGRRRASLGVLIGLALAGADPSALLPSRDPMRRKPRDARSHHSRKAGPGRMHRQGKGRPFIPLPAPDHALDCKLNDHPATLTPRATCNCFRERPLFERNGRLVRANSMRCTYMPFHLTTTD